MLSFYLAFLYADKPYFDKDRMLCMAAYLFEVEQTNSLEQKGLLKRFSLDCYGRQPTMEEIRAEKAAKYEELKHSTKTIDRKEFEKWFLKYHPVDTIGWKRGRQNKPLVDERSEEPTRTIELDLSNKTPVEQSPSPPLSMELRREDENQRANRYRYTQKKQRYAQNRRTRVRRQNKKASSSRHPYEKRVFYFTKR
jgi:hypothetical protein